MEHGSILFVAVLVEAATVLIIWKIKIDPKGKTVWIYFIWVLLCIVIAAVLFEPWVTFRYTFTPFRQDYITE